MARRFGGAGNAKEASVTDDGVFDPVKALDNAKFQDFLAKHEDAGSLEGDPDTSNDEELEKRYNAFRECERISNDFVEFSKNEISNLMGVDLEPSDLEAFSEEVENLAIHDPSAFEEFKNNVIKVKKGPEAIKKLEEKLTKYADMDKVQEDHKVDTKLLEHLNTVQAHFDSGIIKRAGYALKRWVSPNDDFEGALVSLKEAYSPDDISPKNVRKFIEELTKKVEAQKEKISAVEEVTKLKEELALAINSSREQLLTDIAAVKGVSEIISNRAEAQLEALFKEGSVKSLDQMQEKFAKMDDAGDRKVLGIDPLSGLDGEAVQEDIDNKLNETVRTEIRGAIEGVKLGDGAMSSLTKALESYVSRNEMGSKTKEETADFISSVITEVANSLGDSKDAKIKRMLCARILSKIKK